MTQLLVQWMAFSLIFEVFVLLEEFPNCIATGAKSERGYRLRKNNYNGYDLVRLDKVV